MSPGGRYTKRADTGARKEARAVVKAEAPVDEAAQHLRAERRESRVCYMAPSAKAASGKVARTRATGRRCGIAAA